MDNTNIHVKIIKLDNEGMGDMNKKSDEYYNSNNVDHIHQYNNVEFSELILDQNKTLEQSSNLCETVYINDIIINSQKNIKEWTEQFAKYIKIEKDCQQSIENILEIKNNLIKLLGNQNEDDILFYKSIIDNSYFYLTNSLKIRKFKIIKDINIIWKKIIPNKSMNELNKNIFQVLLKDYEKMSKNIYNARINNTTLIWVKNDMIESLYKIETELTEIMIYHNNLIEKIYRMIDLDKSFYYGKK